MIVKEFGYFLYSKNHNMVRIFKDDIGYGFIFNNLSNDNRQIKKSKGKKIKKYYSYEEMKHITGEMKKYKICKHYEGEWKDET